MTPEILNAILAGFAPAAEGTEGSDSVIKPGSLLNLTAAAISAVVKKTYGREYSARVIRYHIAKSPNGRMRKPGRPTDDARAPRVEGDSGETPPKSTEPRRRKRRAKLPDQPAALYNELLLLSGLSESTLYDQLRSLVDNPQAFGSKAKFHEQIKRNGWVPPTKQSDSIRRPTLLTQCWLRLHAIPFEIDPGRSYLVVLAGHERLTGFVNVALYEIQIKNDDSALPPRPPGRPKNFPDEAPSARIYRDDHQLWVQLSASTIQAFCRDTTDRLSLPLTRLTFCQTVVPIPSVLQEIKKLVAEDLRVRHTYPPTMTIKADARDRMRYLAPTLPAGMHLKGVAALLAKYVDKHNLRVAEAAITTIKDVIKAELIPAREDAKLQQIERRTPQERQRDLLRQHYVRPRLSDRKLDAITCRPVRLIGEMIAINLTEQHDSPPDGPAERPDPDDSNPSNEDA